MFNGFPSIHAYEQACANMGFTTRRENFVRDGEHFFVVITSPPETATSISCWTLFSADDEKRIDGGVINGIDSNYLELLKAAGFVKI